MNYDIIVKSEFSAAHKVRLHKGEEESLHGHNWLVEARIGGKKLDENGMVLDFMKARELLKTVLSELDHRNLNELAVLGGENPTAERIARFIYERLENSMVSKIAELVSVTIWETPSCAAVYSKRV